MTRISDADSKQSRKLLLGIDPSIAGLANLLRSRVRMPINFEEILPRAHYNFEKHKRF